MQEAVQLPQLVDLWQSTLLWQPTELQQQQFQRLYQLVVAGNRDLNLTRITEPQEFWEKHLWDSLSGIQEWLSVTDSQPLRTIDIGTGAGFPGVPIAIARPQWSVTLLDSTRKKMAFLETMLPEVPLPNALPVTGRAETIGHQPQHRARYDLAFVRAVAAASACAEYALPLLRVGGSAVLYRGQWTDAETQELQSAACLLGGEIVDISSFTTPLSHGIRHCITLRKTKPTAAQYPRSTGTPTQKPLVPKLAT